MRPWRRCHVRNQCLVNSRWRITLLLISISASLFPGLSAHPRFVFHAFVRFQCLRLSRNVPDSNTREASSLWQLLRQFFHLIDTHYLEWSKLRMGVRLFRLFGNTVIGAE